MVIESFGLVQLSVTPWTVARQASLSMEFSRREYWSGLPFPSPGNLPHPGIEPESPALQADSLSSEPSGNFQWKYDNSDFKSYLKLTLIVDNISALLHLSS